MKKIYVLIKDNIPLFCFEWFEQCKVILEQNKGIKYKSFSYKKDSELSLIEAVQQARDYAKMQCAQDIPTLKEVIEDYILYYNLENIETDGNIAHEEERVTTEKSGNTRRENSNRVNEMIRMAMSGKTKVNSTVFTGYDPVVFYYLFIEMYMSPYVYVFYADVARRNADIKEAIKNKDENKIGMDETALKLDSEYVKLRHRMNSLSEMTVEEHLEVTERAARLLRDTYGDKLIDPLPETIAFKQWITKDCWTLEDVYHELVTNPIYRKRLNTLGGTWTNPDLIEKKSEDTKTEELGMLVDASSELRTALMERVIGQDTVIDRFEKAYFNGVKRSMSGERKKGPKQVYLFAGSPGVGKTYLAESFAEIIDLPYKRFDMAAYGGRNSLEGLVGFEKTYRAATAGVLTSFVYKNPQCVLLIDEIEKAHPQVILNFLQILDDGSCIDKYYDINVSFRDAIIIFTTNAGRQLYEGAENRELSLLSEKKIIDALVKDTNPETKEPYFPTAIASRLSSYTVLMFNHLKSADIIKVAEKDIENVAKINAKKFGIKMSGLKDLAPTILFSLGGRADARNASKKAGQFMDHELYRFMSLASTKYDSVTRELKGLKWTFDYGDSEEVREMYLGLKEGVIAIFTDLSVEKSLLLDNNNVRVISTTDKDEFVRIIENEEIIYAVVDYTYGMKHAKNLSIADCRSVGREVFEFITEENADLEVFLIDKGSFTEREKNELMLKSGSGFVRVKGESIYSELIEGKYREVSYQKAMKKMFAHHQVLMYDTEHFLNEHSRIGEIKLCNFRLETVIDASDEDEFIGEDAMPNVHWDDIKVSEKLKAELKFFVDYLKNPKEYKKKGLRTPKGVLLYGPPGTGKTSLAKVVATESGLNFIAVGGDELNNGGPEKVESLFRCARKYAPTVLFIDEIDAIGMRRSATGMNAALNRLLIEMDGFKKMDNKPVFVMAATNLGDDIDSALARRFDQKVEVPLPDAENRKWLFEFFMKNHQDAFSEVSEETVNSLVVRSVGLSPGVIENVIETTYREAIRSNSKVTDAMLDDIFEQTLFGEARTDVKMADLKQTAIHEAGHVICDYVTTGSIPNYMTVIGRGDFAGYMVPGEAEKGHLSKQDYLNKICISLGGRAGEVGFYGEDGLSPGIGQDIKDATWYAQNMICSWAMYAEEVGMSYIPIDKIQYHEKVCNLVERILSEQMQRAFRIVNEHKAVVEALVDSILNSDSKSLTKKELENILNSNSL